MLELAPAFARLAASNPDAALIIVGDGKGRAAMEETLRPLGDRVVFAGARPFAEMPIWMGACDLLTLAQPPRGDAQRVARGARLGPPCRGDARGRHPGRRAIAPSWARWCRSATPTRWPRRSARRWPTPYDGAAVAALGARGGWDESAARLHAVLLRACGAPRRRRRGRARRQREGGCACKLTRRRWRARRRPSWPAPRARGLEEPAQGARRARRSRQRAGQARRRGRAAGGADVRRRATRDDRRVSGRAGQVRRARDVFRRRTRVREAPGACCCASSRAGTRWPGTASRTPRSPRWARVRCGTSWRAPPGCSRRRRRGGRWCGRHAGRRRCCRWRCPRRPATQPCCGRGTPTIAGRRRLPMWRRAWRRTRSSPGEIVLLHEAQDWTLAALPPALEALAARGLASGDRGRDPGPAAP